MADMGKFALTVKRIKNEGSLADPANPTWRVSHATKGVATLDEYVEWLCTEGYTSQNKRDGVAFAHNLLDNMALFIATTNKSIDFTGAFLIKAFPQGNLATDDGAVTDQNNRTILKLQARDTLRDSINGVKYEFVDDDGDAPKLRSVKSAYTDATNTFGYGGPDGEAGTVLTGKNIKVDESKPDEGVWLYSEDGTTMVTQVTTFNMNTLSTLAVQYNGDKLVSGNKYQLVLKTRGGNAEAEKPAELRKLVAAVAVY